MLTSALNVSEEMQRTHYRWL